MGTYFPPKQGILPEVLCDTLETPLDLSWADQGEFKWHNYSHKNTYNNAGATMHGHDAYDTYTLSQMIPMTTLWVW